MSNTPQQIHNDNCEQPFGALVLDIWDTRESRSKLIEAICSLLDFENFNSTPKHPECEGQSEKAVQQMKKMIRDASRIIFWVQKLTLKFQKWTRRILHIDLLFPRQNKEDKTE